MTTTVTINAHCSDDKEVSVIMVNKQDNEPYKEQVVPDCESLEILVYDDIQVNITEREKANDS